MNQLEIIGRKDALQELRHLISGGGYAPGDRLPPERELMVQLDVSRATLRRALDTLERDGVIWRHVGKGTFVASEGQRNSLAELAQQVSPVQLTRARLALEPALCREAALHASAQAVAAIGLARDRSVHAETWEEYEAQDDAFHRAVAEATGNVLLLSLFEQLNDVKRAVAWNSVTRDTPRPPRDHTSFVEHDEILAAIEAHDPNAAHDAMRGHLGSVSNRLFGET